MGLRVYRLPLVAGATRLSDVYGAGVGVVNPATDIPFRQLKLQPDPGPATLGDGTLIPGRGLVLSAGGGAASPYAAAVIADGASHYWRLGEPSGTTAADSIAGGANAPGTISGGVTLGQPGPLADGSKAMAFNGTNGTILVGGPLTLPGADCTYEVWLQLTGQGNRMISYGRNDQGWTGYIGLGTDLGGPTYAQFLCGNLLDGTVAIADGQWHHIVCTNANGTQRAFYVDGVLDRTVASSAAPTTFTGPDLSIGGNAGMGYSQGTFAELAIYPLPLTAPKVAAHYALRTSPAGGGGSASPLTLGPFMTGPVKLSQLYALGTGALQITGVPF
jgi:hypothetical protein